jgi:predicted nuclease with TOPRIM domain
LEELVSEGLVQTDKVGASTLFWAFPSAGLQQRNVRIAQLDESLANMKSSLEELQATQAALSEGREENDERAQMEIELKQIVEEEERLEGELQKFIDFDPEHVEEMEKKAGVAFDAANRWTDNVFNVITWLKNKLNMESRDLRAQFQIPDDFDYVEE